MRASKLRIYPVIVGWLNEVRVWKDRLREEDANLANHLRRSAASVALNVAEGSGATGGQKLRAFRIALMEMREAVAVLEIAEGLGYLAPLSRDEWDRVDRIVGTLVRLARPRE